MPAALTAALAAAPAAAQCGADDVHEPNDTCDQAARLAPTLHAGLVCTDVSPDHYAIDVPAGFTLRAEIAFANDAGDLDLYLYDPAEPATCGSTAPGSWLDRGVSLTDDEDVEWTNTGSSTRPVVVVVRMRDATPGEDCNTYDLSASLTPHPCAILGPDAYEPNDSCATARPLLAGYHALRMLPGDQDWFRVTVPPGGQLRLEASYTQFLGDLDLRLWRGDCGEVLASSSGASGLEQVVWSNHSAGPREVVVECAIEGTFVCSQYNLLVHLAGSQNPCAGLDDPWEDNDLCGVVPWMSQGTTSGLKLLWQDDDWFRVQVPALTELRADAFFVHAEGDVDLHFWEACDAGAPSASSTGAGDGESVVATNEGFAPVVWWLQARLADAPLAGCTGYSLELSALPLGSGASFCNTGTGAPCPCFNGGDLLAGCENSHGTGGAKLEASGTPSLAADTLRLTVSGLPPTSPALFFQGTEREGGGAGSAFGDGKLCVAGTVTRLASKLAAGGVAELGAGVGHSSSIADLGGVAVVGELYYQVWYRNNAEHCTPAPFNLSNGYAVDWMP